MKNSVEALKTLKTELLYDPAIPLLAIYQGKTVIQKGTCTCYVHSSTPYVEAKTWTQLKRPSTDKWIKKMWGIYTVESYAARKKSEIMPFAVYRDGPGNYHTKRSKSEREAYSSPYKVTKKAKSRSVMSDSL